MPKLVIRNGRVIDPASRVDAVRDVLIDAGRFAAIGENLDAGSAEQFDASGLIVAPGFIDMHVHLRAKQFYEQLFGWHLEVGQNDPSGYLHIKNGEKFIGGIPPAQHRDPNIPPHWLLYFAVSDVDAASGRAAEMGARAFLPPTSMKGVGRFSVLADPQGAVFALFKPEERG